MANVPVKQRARFHRAGLSVPTIGVRAGNHWPSIVRTATATAFALCLCSLALAARSEAYVYWANDGTDSIGRANLDGTGVDRSFITGAGHPGAIAIDSDHVYWTNRIGVGRANLDGSAANPSFFGLAADPSGLAVDGGYLYWANPGSTIGTGTIGRANLDGTGANPGFLTGLSLPQGVAVDRGHVYWTSAFTGTVGRADLNGTGANELFILGAALGDVAVDANHVYWGSNVGVGRANLDGSAANPSFVADPGIRGGVAIDTNHVYWTNFVAIGRANLDGTNPSQGFIGGLFNARSVAVNDLPHPPNTTPADITPPETTISRGAPNKIEKNEVTFRFSSSELDSTFECRLDQKAFRACGSPKKVRRLDEGRHRFKVRAIDAAGNVDSSAAKDKFKVVG
jgi:virginiamycin B lyase